MVLLSRRTKSFESNTYFSVSICTNSKILMEENPSEVELLTCCIRVEWDRNLLCVAMQKSLTAWVVTFKGLGAIGNSQAYAFMETYLSVKSGDICGNSLPINWCQSKGSWWASSHCELLEVCVLCLQNWGWVSALALKLSYYRPLVD